MLSYVYRSKLFPLFIFFAEKYKEWDFSNRPLFAIGKRSQSSSQVFVWAAYQAQKDIAGYFFNVKINNGLLTLPTF